MTRRTAEYIETVATRLEGILREHLVGVYLHGSAVLGDFSEECSDIDLVAVSARPLSWEEKRSISEHLSQKSLQCPARGLEFHVVEKDSIAPSDAPAYELHVATSTAGNPDRVVDGHGGTGDPDLVMHFAVLREYGRALVGPKSGDVFPRIPRPMLLRAFSGELDWAAENALPSYQVLNACRAWRFLDEGVLCSKTAGGEWARERVADPSAVDMALQHRRGLTGKHPDPERARALLWEIRRKLETNTTG